MLLPHILHWLPMAIRINKVIRDLPFFFFFLPFQLHLVLPGPAACTEHDRWCRDLQTHHFLPPLLMFAHVVPSTWNVHSTSELCKFMCRWLCEAFVNHPQTAAPSHLETTTHGPLLHDSVMHKTSQCSYLWYKGPWATGGQSPWLVIIEEMSVSYRIRNLMSLQQIFAELMNKWINSKGSCGLIVMGLEYPAE